MATLLGDASEPTASSAWFGASSNNKMAFPLVIPSSPAGNKRILQVGFWAAGKDASPLTYAAVWDGGGSLYGYSAGFNMANLPFALGNNVNYLKDVWVSGNPANGHPVAAAGVTVYAGWARAHASAHQYGQRAGGTDHYMYSNATVPGSFNYASTDPDAIGVYLYWELANTVPNAPTNLSPTGGVIITGADLTPALSFLYTDPDSNNMSAYEVEIDNNSDFSSPVWDSGKVALVQAHNTTVIVSPSVSLSRGVLYYWRARVWDSNDAVSAWSA